MFIGKLPIFAWGGILLFFMVAFQLLIATRIIPIDMKYHRINGFVILGFALVHGLLGLLYFLG